jgi:exosome complex RNA-binding protein Csl4
MVANSKIIAPNKTAGVPLQPGGIYLGVVRQMSGNQAFVEVPSIQARFAFGPCLVLATRVSTTTTQSDGYLTSVTVENQPPQVGDRVICAFLNNEKSELVVLGRVLS